MPTNTEPIRSGMFNGPTGDYLTDLQNGYIQLRTPPSGSGAQASSRPSVLASSLGCAGNGTTDDSGRLQGAINNYGPLGYGLDLLLDQPAYGLAAGLVNNYVGIQVRGYGGNWRHSNTTSGGATTLRALTAGMTMMQYAAPLTGLGTNFGFGGVEGVYFDGHTIADAAIGLEVLTWHNGRFSQIGGNQFTNAAIHLGVVASGSWATSETRSPQHNEFDSIALGADYSAGTHTGYGLLLDGDTSNGLPGPGNASLNTFRDVAIWFTNGDAVHWGNSDNDKMINLWTFRLAGGTAFSVFFGGATAAGLQSRAQTIIGYTSNAPIKVEGTDTATVAAGTPTIYAFDQDNSSPTPTLGTGASVRWIDTTGVLNGPYQAVGMTIGETRGNATSAPPQANSSLTVFNSAQAHIVMSNGTQTGRVYMSGNGPVIGRLSGGAFVDLEGGLHVQGTTFVECLANNLIVDKALRRSFQTPAEAVLVSGVDATAGEIVSVTLTAARLVGLPLNPATGQRLSFVLIQGGAGAFAVTWNAVFKVSWSDTGNTTGKRSTIAFQYDGANWNQDGAQTPYV